MTTQKIDFRYNLDRIASPLKWSDGKAVVAADYSIGRDLDAPNQLHLNVPTGATFELSVNDTPEFVFSATQLDLKSNNIVNLGTLNTHTIPGGTDTFVLLAAAQTLTAKTLTSPTVNTPVLILATGTPTAAARLEYSAGFGRLGDGTASQVLVSEAQAQTLAAKTLTAPAIADFTNAAHAHAAPSSGGAVVAASLTVAGIAELATAAEINTGTDTTRAIPVDQYVASARNVRYVLYRVLDPATNMAVANVVGGDLEIPFTGTITEIGAYVDTAGVTGLATIDVNKAGITILSTKITIDSAEKSSRTAATAPVLSTIAVVAGDLVTIDIDGIQTTAAKGLTIRIGIRVT